ncbi:MAG: PilZ domain-containing protein, partial [Candidatus Acidiferrum sp.]
MSPTPINERRRSRRRKPSQLVYLEFGRDNGGMVKDVSEDGMRFSLMGPVVVGQTLPFSVSLDSVRRIAGQAKMIWTEANGKSG